MKNAKLVGWGLILSIVFTFMVAFLASEEKAEGGYLLAGLMYVVFAIWGGVILINHDK